MTTGPGSMATCPKLFIAGCPRSGTTWVHDVLRVHPGAVTTLETALFDFLRVDWTVLVGAPLKRERRRVGDEGPVVAPVLDALERLLVRRRPPWYGEWREVLVRYFGSRGAFVLNHSGVLRVPTLWARLRGRLVSYPDLLAAIAAAEAVPGAGRDEKVARVARAVLDGYFLRRGGTAGQLLVEKTPSHLFHADFILRWLPEARLIEVVRDGRDVCVSMDSYRRWMPQDRRFQAWLWARYVEAGCRLESDPSVAGRVLRVRYEALKEDPAREVRRILEHAELAAAPDVVGEIVERTRIENVARHGEGRHYRKGVVGDWLGRLTEEDLDVLRQEAGPAFALAGYALGPDPG